MSSGSLPLGTYHRAESLGAGSFGSVITVYDDDGNSFALKMFDQEEDDDDDGVGISLGALREISLLRLFRKDNAHPNIIEMHDVQTAGLEEGEGGGGAGTTGVLAMALPIFPRGNLQDSISAFHSKKEKVEIAHGLLNAVAHLHENGIIHRDIKCDNILLQDTEHNTTRPVLIDFSLAKIVDPAPTILGSSASSIEMTESMTHTPSVGTPTYRAPEVIQQEDYGLASDLWSVGVCLLELLRGKCLEVEKDKNATILIASCLEGLPDAPFPNLIRALLEIDPSKRVTAREALNAKVFQKFGLEPDPRTFRTLNIQDALPLENDEGIEVPADGKENQPAAAKSKSTKRQNSSSLLNPKIAKRFQRIQMICESMEWTNPMTSQAALTYSIQMSELEEVDDMNENQTLLDCIVLAHKFFELHLSNLEELQDSGGRFEGWDLDGYADNEGTIFTMLDFSLYPRYFVPTS
eukprot:scaffold5276_cov134-Cylindrotheca_fusiformis.AAC.8